MLYLLLYTLVLSVYQQYTHTLNMIMDIPYPMHDELDTCNVSNYDPIDLCPVQTRRAGDSMDIESISGVSTVIACTLDRHPHNRVFR